MCLWLQKRYGFTHCRLRVPLNELKWDETLKEQAKKHTWNKKWTADKINITKLTHGHYLRFKDYINHITSYAPYVPELKRYIFKFKRFYVSEARKNLSVYGYGRNDGTAFVSIHVRLTDYHTALKGLSIISKQYFSRAMEYFATKYTVSRYTTKFAHKCSKFTYYNKTLLISD